MRPADRFPSTAHDGTKVQHPLQCKYRNGKCRSARTVKHDGTLHTLCALHRARSIANQKRFDAKRRVTGGGRRAPPLSPAQSVSLLPHAIEDVMARTKASTWLDVVDNPLLEDGDADDAASEHEVVAWLAPFEATGAMHTASELVTDWKIFVETRCLLAED